MIPETDTPENGGTGPAEGPSDKTPAPRKPSLPKPPPFRRDPAADKGGPGGKDKFRDDLYPMW